MKLRHPWLLKMAARLGVWAFRPWMKTLRWSYRSLGPDLRPMRLKPGSRYVYAFWHDVMLMPSFYIKAPGSQVMISKSGDGQLIADVCAALGFEPVRGSSSRDAVTAVRQILRAGQRGHVVVTPDGPRGPRHQVQPGVVYLASRTGLPIVPSGFGCERPWRFNSWDRFQVPRPFTRAACVVGEPVIVPASLDRDGLEHYRRTVEEALLHVTDLAEKWAEAGAWPGVERRAA